MDLLKVKIITFTISLLEILLTVDISVIQNIGEVISLLKSIPFWIEVTDAYVILLIWLSHWLIFVFIYPNVEN